MQMAIERQQLPPEIAEHPDARMINWIYEAIGSIQRGERMAYILYEQKYVPGADEPEADSYMENHRRKLTAEERELVDDQSQAPPFIQTARLQHDGEWRLIAGHDFLGRGNFIVGFESVATSEGTE